jgi:hypothetical protein
MFKGARMLAVRFRISLAAWMLVSCVCCLVGSVQLLLRVAHSFWKVLPLVRVCVRSRSLNYESGKWQLVSALSYFNSGHHQVKSSN